MIERVGFADFETYAIQARPDYPPKPVGLAYEFGKEKGYEACRSPSDRKRCATLLKGAAADGFRLCYHNASFDLDVAETHLGVRWPIVHHDTLLLAYLNEPRAATFRLKNLGESELGIIPKERDKLKEWIIEHVSGATEKTWGAYISEAPFELVRPYATQDVTLTKKLFQHFMKLMHTDARMMGAYSRELKVTHVLVKMERHGVPVATSHLRKDLKLWRAQKEALENKLFSDLKVAKKDRSAEFAWSGKNFAHQVVKSGLVAQLPRTAKGNPSTAADTLGPLIPKKVAERLELRAQLQTCIVTFGDAWMRQAENGGRFYARYNQVRQDYHGTGGMVGTATGRLSMSPNLQNVIRSDKGDLVPQLRRYLVSLTGGWWLKRDFSQQELRIFAHYSEGELLERYRANPKIDAHTACSDILFDRTGLRLSRRDIKDINFGVVYGMGVAKMASKLNLDLATGKKVIGAYHRALPEVRQLQKALKQMAALGEPYYTLGGRKYFCEPPRVVKVDLPNGMSYKKEQTYEYKMLNGLVQGSAADATKEAMIRYDATGWNEPDKAPMVLQVHDELNALAPNGEHKAAMKALRESMESIELDIPLLSDGSASRTSWDAVTEVNW